MSLPIENRVRKGLEPFNTSIRQVIDKGFKSYLTRRGGGNLYRRTDSAEIFDNVIRAALAEFTNASNVKVFPLGATARFLFGGTVLVRFKKASRQGRGQNIPTAANDNWIDPAIPFADAPHAMKVEICWKVNKLGTGFTDVYVTARRGEAMLWRYELPGGAQQLIAFPSKRAAAPPRRRSVAKLKDSNKSKKKNSSGEAS